MRLYGQIQKIEPQDDGTIKVHGIASTQDVDDQGETVLGAAMRAAIPDYMKFPALREMHQLQAAGTTLEVDVDKDNITRLIAHVVDPVAISKVKNQVYRGFSIGGRVTKRDHIDSKIITGIQLNEISLVDRPANPAAVLDCWKAGVSEGEHSMSGLGTLADTEAGKKLAALQPVQVWTCGEPEHQHVAKAEAEKCMAARGTANEHELEKARLVPVDKEAEPPLTLDEVAKRAEEGAIAAQDALLEAQRAIERGEVTLVDDQAVKTTDGATAESPADSNEIRQNLTESAKDRDAKAGRARMSARPSASEGLAR